MMKRQLISIFLQATVLCSTAQTVPAKNTLKQVDALLQKHYRSNEPGAAVMIINNGKLVYKKCYGITSLQHKVAITPKTGFNIGSITKQFTALAILQLVQNNRLSLSDPVSKYLPGINHVVTNRVTIRHLLTHTSGIIDHYAYTDTTQGKHARDKDVLKAVEKTDSLYFVPGSDYRYSNTAYCLLALIIEKVSDLSYADYIKKNIFGPLKMKHSVVLNPGEPIPARATGYRWDAANRVFIRSDREENFFFSTQGDGGIYASLNDYAKWLKALENGQLISPALMKEAREIQCMIDPESRLGYGYGWFIRYKETSPVVYHTGSNGGFRSVVYTQPEKGYALVLFSNRSGIDLEQLAEEINSLLRPRE